jgi:uncharacterized integral membrane protein
MSSVVVAVVIGAVVIGAVVIGALVMASAGTGRRRDQQKNR